MYRTHSRDIRMERTTKEALQVTKEIVVKFIETGRVSPTNFSEVFPSVHRVVLAALARTDTEQAQPASKTDKEDTQA